MVERIDLIGQAFGQWTVLSYVGGRYRQWLCRCSCGTERPVRDARLRGGRSGSCGCRVAGLARDRMLGKSGPLNATWKGEQASYFAKHLRLRSRRGMPKRCEQCGQDDPNRRYEWANMTGNYDDPMDYRRLCVPCHRRMDGNTPPENKKRSQRRLANV